MPEEQQELLARHREQLAEAEKLIMAAIRSGDRDEAITAKTVMDALRVKQEAERRAWNIADTEDGGSGPEVINIVWKA